MDLGLRGRKALVTGGTRGIGRAVADLLAMEGCDVAICARSPGAVADTAAALRARGVNSFGEALDVADGEALEGFVNRAAAALGGLDIVVANISGAMGLANDAAGWRRSVDVDILATVRGCEAAVPHLERSGAGAIVVVGTVSAVEITGARKPYAAVKAALVPYVKGLARDLATRGIRANMVSPGSIFFEGGIWDVRRETMPEQYHATLARIPMGRFGRPEEIADAVVYLASPRASYVTGANLICDGAITQRVDF